MNRSLRRLRLAVSFPRLLPHIIIMLMSPHRWLITADLIRWAEVMHLRKPQTTMDMIGMFVNFMTFTPEFRNVFYLRAGRRSRLLAWLCPRLPDLDIAPTKIGPGLFIQHGNSTFISAREIGENCWIGRHVVVGYSNETDFPTIGDNVRIFSGAKIVGNITIGSNATVGLNSVVIDHVAPNTTVLGVPARVIWRASAPPA